MCGISGIILRNGTCDIDSLSESIRSLAHRGPDGYGIRVLNDNRVGLCHARLSIIDLTAAGHQPMSNEDDTIWLTFNGEIYNYQILRKNLMEYGHRFKSYSDSEVILHGYEQWGIDVFNRIEGMFALAIWDERSQCLILARDRLGIKPLNYYLDNKVLIFGSELKAITCFKEFNKRLNYQGLVDYLNYSAVPAPMTIWHDTFKLEPGHYLIYRRDCETESKQYWSIKPGRELVDPIDAIEEAGKLLRQAVEGHLVSDVPIGLFLSSGYDSSALLLFMQSFVGCTNTYSIGFKNSIRSEHVEAAIIANHFGTRHHELLLDEDYLSITRSLFNFYDEPFAVSSMVSYHYASSMASKRNKVVFAGDGGDEVFGGYKWYNEINALYQGRRWWDHLFSSSTASIRDFYLKVYKRRMCSDPSWVKTIASKNLQNQCELTSYSAFEMPEEYWHLHPVKVLQLLDYKYFVPDIALPRADHSSMSCSLEVRVPFLDHHLVEFTMRLDPTVYFKIDKKKFLLYENIRHGIPENVLNLPKRGFSNPLDNFFEKRRDVAVELRNSELFKSNELFDNIDFEKQNPQQLWLLYCLECWYSKWM